MTWLTWRLFRAQAITAAACLAVLAVAFGYTGRHLGHLYAVSGAAACRGDCDRLAARFFTTAAQDPVYLPLFWVGAGLLVLLPAIVGAFWGAPLISRELETGTYKLAWSQDRSRTGWLAIKVGLVGVATAVTAGLASWLFTWWAGPVDASGGFPVNQGHLSRLAPQMFIDRGVVPVGWALFGFMLGVTFGLLTRRAIPAMAITIAVLALVQVLWPAQVRSYLVPRAHASAAITSGSVVGNDMVPGREGQLTVSVDQVGTPLQLPGAWIISNVTLTRSGQRFTLPRAAVCQGNGFGEPRCNDYIARQHLSQQVSYIPAREFWRLQWTETVILLALSLALAGICLWRVRRLRA
jgi:hypothetical protein